MKFSELIFLFLNDNNAITDDGIIQLTKMKDLKYVSLAGTQVTQRGIDALRKAFPKVTIEVPSASIDIVPGIKKEQQSDI